MVSMLHEGLAGRLVHSIDAGYFRPLLLGLQDPADRERLSSLIDAGGVRNINDSIRQQCVELAEIRRPGHRPGEAEVEAIMAQLAGGGGSHLIGRWVYYPWSGQLVHLLPCAEFREVRLNRNRHKILATEQAHLASRRVGIVGLSVGHAIAVTMVLEGIGGYFRLADPDVMSLSNLNRVPSSVGATGLNKTVVAARRMFDLDPYLEIDLFPEGVTDKNRLDFLAGGASLDVLIEECDDLHTKIAIREDARRLGIPVVMATNDRGLLDIERFDRDPSRPILHGLLGDRESRSLKGLPSSEKGSVVLQILGGGMSTRMAASMIEVDETLTGWSQLGSGTIFDAGVVGDAIRKMFLGQTHMSARFMLDLETLVSDSAGTHTVPVSLSPDLSDHAEPAAPLAAFPGRLARTPSPEDIRWLVELATLAPSGGNRQPWIFRFLPDGRLIGELDVARASSFLDFENGAAIAACGAALCNLEIAAASLGLAVETVLTSETTTPRLFEVRFEPNDSVATPVPLDLLRSRCTNRNLGVRSPLLVTERDRLAMVAGEAQAALHIINDEEQLHALGNILGQVDRFRLLSPPLFDEMMGELRWTSEDAVRTGDGIAIHTLGFNAADLAGLRLAAQRPVIDVIRQLHGGRRFEDLSRRIVAASSAVGLVTTAGLDQRARVVGGRAFQRVWLEATALGLALQPMAVAPFLFARLERGRGAGLTLEERTTLGGIRSAFREIFPTPSGHSEVLLFRLARAPSWEFRSNRRPLDQVLSFA